MSLRTKGFSDGGSHCFFPRHRRQPREEIDFWLDDNYLYRKRVARDASCLFRIVAEQVFQVEIEAAIIRRSCVRYMERHPELFVLHIKEDFKEYLNRMRSHETPGSIQEMICMSALFRCKFLVYERHHQPPKVVTLDPCFKKLVRICDGGGNHFDGIHDKHELTVAGIAQAITYEILYKGVFEMAELDTYVHLMLDEPSFTRGYQGKSVEEAFLKRQFKLDKRAENLFHKFGPPFPYKVAKSLQPFIFRNVGFDVWIEERKDLIRMEQGFVYGPKMVVGARVQVLWKNPDKPNDEPESHVGFIQKFTENKGPVDVVLLDTGKIVPVPHDEIIPLDEGRSMGNLTSSSTLVEGVNNGSGSRLRDTGTRPNANQLPMSRRSRPEGRSHTWNQANQWRPCHRPGPRFQNRNFCQRSFSQPSMQHLRKGNTKGGPEMEVVDQQQWTGMQMFQVPPQYSTPNQAMQLVPVYLAPEASGVSYDQNMYSYVSYSPYPMYMQTPVPASNNTSVPSVAPVSKPFSVVSDASGQFYPISWNYPSQFVPGSPTQVLPYEPCWDSQFISVGSSGTFSYPLAMFDQAQLLSAAHVTPQSVQLIGGNEWVPVSNPSQAVFQNINAYPRVVPIDSTVEQQVPHNSGQDNTQAEAGVS